MNQADGKHHGAFPWGTVGLLAELGETHFSTLVFAAVEVDRQCETPMGRGRSAVIDMRTKISADRRIVARQQIPFDAAGFKLKSFGNKRRDPFFAAGADGALQTVLLDQARVR
ncbi:MAG TPA: hypothetical protein VM661_05505 [Candidatus Sulfotelmatobacter sp.]|jgi:hypothetical protein|nr:hypothetical protein [Candidatus Sulfotelmatobacter sp.]